MVFSASASLKKVGSMILLTLMAGSVVLAQNTWFKAPERGITSWKPAPNWEHGLLSGNGTMGAIVFGDPHEETIILNHDQLYVPREQSSELINQAERLEEIRELIKNGQYEEAAKIPVEIRKAAGYNDDRDPYMPAFDLSIMQEPANIQQYVRATDFETGEAITTWKDDVGKFQRKLFVSRADSIIVLSIKADSPINCKVQFDNRPVEWNQWSFVNEHIDEMTAEAEGMWLTYKSKFKKKNKGGLEGYEGVGRIILSGGTAKSDGKSIEISQADEVLILIKIRPNYNYEQSLIPQIKEELSGMGGSYGQLLEQHKTIHAKIFNRVRLSLSSKAEDKRLHTEEILLRAKEGDVPLALIEKVFDAGRYNILSSTGMNPPNLQGIWSGTWTPAWSSSFTHDGNLPSAMSVVMPGNMPELMKSYVQYHQRYLEDYKENAEKLFGTRGINLPVHTTTEGWPTDFNEIWCLTLWTGGAAWAADIMYDYYLYTLDKDYLAKYAYPWLKQVAWFYEDFLYEGANGKYVFNPSYSPENNPRNSSSQAALNATMDVMLAKQVLSSVIEAGEVLKEDKSQLKKWQEMLDKLPGYEVNQEGVLREWIWPGFEDNYRHRHVSQLYSLYNHRDADIIENEMLRKGAVKLIEKKLEFRREEGGGEMAFGLVQLGLSAAHLGEAGQAEEAVNWLSSRYWSAGFGSFHNVGALLNTDISGGLPAVIIHMLAYSGGNNSIYLLPALPEDWKTGNITGISLRNRITLTELKWNEREVLATLESHLKQGVKIKLPGGVEEVYLLKGAEEIKLKVTNREIKVDLPAQTGTKLRLIMKKQ
ncbi:glycoside hydrolase N-terminal domain-containing protein [Fulvivirga sp. 29W222]|uniref:Glycoside hydrolase N-terminal domain-containing protein n=1 Tax=Fulvivirga marina TaxID=2494733 RepID=A0A937KC66_9BACT|nr:glycoside hydrolase N-terminal domain-containing protein [Fulvivirga marina]MBL6447182.1 glycoside hydrolase N-terminal domain-containing protein [Fulvivirga marina]